MQFQIKLFTASSQADLEAQVNAFLVTLTMAAIADITTQVVAVTTGPPKFYATVVFTE